MSVIIPRHTSIPAKCTQMYTTTENNSTSLNFKLLEGERAMADDNNLLGEMVLNGIPPMRRGLPKILVTFQIDENGILQTSAVEQSTGTTANATISYDEKRLKKEDLDSMIVDAEKLRVEDGKKRETAEASNDLRKSCDDIEDAIELGNISVAAKKAISEKCSEIKKWLKNNDGCSKHDFESKKKELDEFYKKYKV